MVVDPNTGLEEQKLDAPLKAAELANTIRNISLTPNANNSRLSEPQPEDINKINRDDNNNPFGPGSFTQSSIKGFRAAQNILSGADNNSNGLGNDDDDDTPEQRRRKEQDKEAITNAMLSTAMNELINNAHHALDGCDEAINNATNILAGSIAASDAYRDGAFVEAYQEYSDEAQKLRDLKSKLEEGNLSDVEKAKLQEQINEQTIVYQQALDKYTEAARPMNEAFEKRNVLESKMLTTKEKMEELKNSLDGATDAEKIKEIEQQLNELKTEMELLTEQSSEVETTIANFQSQTNKAESTKAESTTTLQAHLTYEMKIKSIEQQLQSMAEKNPDGTLTLDNVDDFSRNNPNVSLEKIATIIGDKGLVLDVKSAPNDLQEKYLPLINDNDIVKVPDYSNNDVAANYDGINDLGPNALMEERNRKNLAEIELAQQQLKEPKQQDHSQVANTVRQGPTSPSV